MSLTNSPPMPIPRILLVMSRRTLCDSVVQVLQQNQFVAYDTVLVDPSDDVAPLIQRRAWDLAICDYAPFKTAEFIEAVRRIQPQMRVIVLAEQITIRETAALMRLGARDVVEFTELERLGDVVQVEFSAPQLETASASLVRLNDDLPEKQIRELLDSMQDAVISTSLPDQRVVYISASFEKVFGYPAQAFLDDPNFFKRVVHPDDYERAIAARESGINGGFVELDHRIILPDGQVRWLHRRAWVIFDAQGRPTQVIDTARDITERKRIEEELGVANRKQRAILDTIPDLMFHVRVDGTVLDYHFHASVADLVLPPEAFLNKSAGEIFKSPLVPVTILQQALDAIRAAATLHQPIVFEYTMPDQHWYEARIMPIEDSDELIIMSRDITERKQREAELRASEEKHRSLIESLDAVIAMIDANGIIVYVNMIGARDFGLIPDQMIGRPLREFFPPESAEIQLADTNRVIETGVGMVREAPSIIAGGERWYRTSIQPVRDSAGTVTAVLVNSTDITELKQIEKALRASEELLHIFIEHAPVALAMFDQEMRYLAASRRWIADYRLPETGIIGQIHYDVFGDIPDRWRDAHKRGLRGEVQAVEEDEFRRLDDSVLWLRWAIHPWYSTDGAIGGIIIFAEDITERKQAEDALRRNEAYLRSLVNSEAAFNLRVDMQGKITYCNDSYRRQFAWAVPSLVGANSFEVVHPDDQPIVYAAVRECLADPNRPARLEIRKRTESGGYIWTLWEFSAVTVSDGTVLEIHCVGFDITKQKEAESALQEANRLLEQRIQERTTELQAERTLLRTVIDAIPDYIYVKDRQHRMQLNNAAYVQAIGVKSGAELIGKTDLDLLPIKFAAQFHDDEARLFETGQAIYNLEEHVFRPDGIETWMLTTKVPLRNAHGEVVGLVGTTRDISSIKRAGEALRISEERYRATVASMSEGIVVQNMDGSIQLCNTAAERILGLTEAQMIGRTSVDPLWRAVHEDGSPFPGEAHPAMVTLRTGEPQSNVIMGVHKPDGSLTWILINAQPLIDPITQQLYAVVTTFADITAPKLAEAALKAALVQEKELGELKSRLVSMASHEFRTPLASILAATETLTSYWERLDKAKIDDRLTRIRQQVAHMTEIIEDTLQLTRLQTGRIRYEPAPGDLDVLCTDLISEFTDLPEYEGRIVYESQQCPIPVIYDDRLMRQAISNLLQNALKYSAHETAVRVTLECEGGQITLRVVDGGIGIPPEDLKRLFEPFHRAANVTAISGTGLGLSITKQAIELHGGTITVDSQLGSGTTFTVVLPGQPE